MKKIKLVLFVSLISLIFGGCAVDVDGEIEHKADSIEHSIKIDLAFIDQYIMLCEYFYSNQEFETKEDYKHSIAACVFEKSSIMVDFSDLSNYLDEIEQQEGIE